VHPLNENTATKRGSFSSPRSKTIAPLRTTFYTATMIWPRKNSRGFKTIVIARHIKITRKLNTVDLNPPLAALTKQSAKMDSDANSSLYMKRAIIWKILMEEVAGIGGIRRRRA